jgi:hypothetical protein
MVAIAGLAVAVALALRTSHLTTQHVGLGGEPSRPASGLVAPISSARPAPARAARPARQRPRTVTVPPPSVTVAPQQSPAPRGTAPTRQREREHKDD